MDWSTVLFVLFALYFLFSEPILGYYQFQRHKQKQSSGNNSKMDYYREIIAQAWIPTGIVLGLILFDQISPADIGFGRMGINTSWAGPWLPYLIIGLAALYMGSLIYHVLANKWSAKYRTKFTLKMSKVELPDYVRYMLPISKEEKRTWGIIALSAGITEEIVYRGLLLYGLNYIFPNGSSWILILIGSMMFGLAHTYQGWQGVLKTALLGAFFSALYLSTDSLLPGMLLHLVVDWTAKDMTGEEPAISSSAL